MPNQNQSKSRGFSPTGDCESSFTMRIKCRRVHLIVLLVALLGIFAATSSFLHAEHQRSVSLDEVSRYTPPVSTKGSPVRDYRRARPNLPTVNSAQSARMAFELPRKKAKEEKLSEKRRGEVVKFFNDKMKTQQKKKKKRAAEKREKNNKVNNKIDPIPSSLAPNATFAACLLIKDDNEILPEWLAYHYHVIGMRDLIVAVDPLSREYPTSILERWSSLTDMRIQEWNDEDYMPSDFLVYQKPPEKYMQNASDFTDLSAEDLLEVSNHRYRQRVFLAKCMKEFRDRGNSWVMHIDTDEVSSGYEG